MYTEILTHSPCNVFDAEPPEWEHAGVVVYVKEGHLVVLLPHHEEYGVQELDALGEIIPPQRCSNLENNGAACF